MKQLLISVLMFFVSYNCLSQNHLVINGKVDGKSDVKVFLFNWTGGKPVKLDSIISSGGVFSFNKIVQSPSIYLLTLGKSSMPVFLFPETEPIKVSLQIDHETGRLTEYKVSAGNVQSAYNAYIQASQNLNNDYQKLVEDYDKARGEKNEATMKSQNEKMMAKEKAMSDLELKMIDNNPDNMLSLLFICNKYQKTDPGTAKAKLAKVSSHLQSSELYKHLNK